MTLSGRAQERVRNVRVRVADSSQLEIRYDLINARPGDSIYVEVRSRLRGLLRILPEFVRGDLGRRVVAGSDRRIVWSALANGYSLNEEVRATVLVRTDPAALLRPAESVAVAAPQPRTDRPAPTVAQPPARPDSVAVTPAPVEARPGLAQPGLARPDAARPTPPVQPPAPRSAEPAARPDIAPPGLARPDAARPKPTTPTLPNPTSAPDTVASRKKRYAGPAWALLSAVAPGFGNVFVQMPKPRLGFRPLLAVGCYGLLVYGLQQRQQSRDTYAVYLDQKNAETAEPYYQTANSYYHRYYLATRGAIVVAAADVILTFFKGMRNVRTAAVNRPPSPVTFRPGLQAGQPTAVMRYSF